MFSKSDQPLHHLLDIDYHHDRMISLLEQGVNPDAALGPNGETALHVAVRRRRLEAVEVLLEHGINIDAKTSGGKTAYAHAIRRKFDEISDRLAKAGADTSLNMADHLAVALVNNQLVIAENIITDNPGLVPKMKPEEVRILPDLAGRNMPDAVKMLIRAGVDLSARGLDGGTALHQAAWFGQPEMANILIEYHAPLNILCEAHRLPPIGWLAHGSVYSGGADERSTAYARIAESLLSAGAELAHPLKSDSEPRGEWLLRECSEAVGRVIRNHIGK